MKARFVAGKKHRAGGPGSKNDNSRQIGKPLVKQIKTRRVNSYMVLIYLS